MRATGLRDPAAGELTSKRLLATTLVLAGAWVIVLAFRDLVPEAARLHSLADAPHPYWQPGHAALLYGAVPVLAVAAFLVGLTPGLLLALGLRGAHSPGEWILQSLALSVVMLAGGNAVVLRMTGRPVTTALFLAMAGGLSIVMLLVAWSRVGRTRASPWPVRSARDRAIIVAMALGPAILLIVLAPKFLWESFNGDGAHAFEASRLLVSRPFPFFDADAGIIANWPGVTSMLFTYPTSWFIHLFGPIEFSARIPFMLYLAAVFGGVCALSGRDEAKHRWAEIALIWLALAVYGLVMAFSATYSPYSADLALPGTQDTLLVVWFLGFVLAASAGRHGWLVLFGLLTYLTLPNGLLLLGLWWLGMAVLWRPRPWGTLVLIAGVAVGCMAIGAVAPQMIGAAGLAAPGRELGTAGLIGRFNWLQLTDWRRFLYLAVPCGILPAVALVAWKRQDTLSRTMTLVTAAYFAFTYVQAYASLHYYVPVMLTPLVVFWRNRWVAPQRRPALLAATAVAGAVALWLSVPESAQPYTVARQVGRDIENRVGNYSVSSADQFRATNLLTELFAADWDPKVPRRTLGGSPLVWNYYAHSGDGDANYVLQRATDPRPAQMLEIARDSGFVLLVEDTAAWNAQRSIRPPTPAGARIYQVSRAVLFRSGSGEDGFRIFNVRALLKRLRSR